MVLITRRPANAQASLRTRAVSPEPSLFAHIKYGSIIIIIIIYIILWTHLAMQLFYHVALFQQIYKHYTSIYMEHIKYGTS